MDDWVGYAIATLAAAIIAAVGNELSGGFEGRLQRKILANLDIARGFGAETQEGKKILRVARDDADKMLKWRKTRLSYSWSMTALVGSVVAVLTLVASAFFIGDLFLIGLCVALALSYLRTAIEQGQKLQKIKKQQESQGIDRESIELPPGVDG